MANKHLTTPKGKAVWPRLTEPDTKFNSAGVYSAKIHVSEKDFKVFDAEVRKIYEAYHANVEKETGKKHGESEGYPCSITKEGDFQIHAKQVAKKLTDKGLLEFSVALFDSKGAKINDKPNVGSGSILKLSVEPVCWAMNQKGAGLVTGISLRLKAAQIIELKEFGGGGGDFGFGEEGDGFVSETFETEFENEEQSKGSIPF
tara:strand:- start:42 stop:647 length:606 start_codon:yes stop_codon:yes gene_type:complete